MNTLTHCTVLLALAALTAQAQDYPLTAVDLVTEGKQVGMLRLSGPADSPAVHLVLIDEQGQQTVREGVARPSGPHLEVRFGSPSQGLARAFEGQDAAPELERLLLLLRDQGRMAHGEVLRGSERLIAFHGERAGPRPPKRGTALVVISAAKTVPVTDSETGQRRDHETGFFLGELTLPLQALEDDGWEPIFATPGGVAPTLDRDSLRDVYWFGMKKLEAEGLRLLARHARALAAPRSLASLTEAELESIPLMLIPGGHAPMVDLAVDVELGRVLRHFHARGKPTGMVCHGPVALLSTLTPGQPWIYAGYRATVVTDAEERAGEKAYIGGRIDWYPETRLRELGMKIEGAPIATLFFSSRSIVDRELLTCQNPWAGRRFARDMVEAGRRYLQSGSLREADGAK